MKLPPTRLATNKTEDIGGRFQGSSRLYLGTSCVSKSEFVATAVVNYSQELAWLFIATNHS